MQKPVNQRQLAWISSEAFLTPENFLAFADKLQSISGFGPVQNPILTFSGGALPLQLTGNIEQVKNDLEQLTDKRFTSGNLKFVFPNTNNLVVNVSVNFAFGHINVTLQNGTDDSAQKIFLLATDFFPRASGLSDHEIEQQTLRLTNLIKEAEKATEASRESLKINKKAKEHEEVARKFVENIKSFQQQSSQLFNNIKKLFNESSQKAVEITNFRNQIQSHRDTTQKLQDDVSANEAKIRDFFNEIEEFKRVMNSTKNDAENTVKSSRAETNNIIKENKILQEEIKEHLLKAVGTSLFSAFEERKKKIEISKWIWAALTVAAIIAQVIVIVWIANHVQSLSSNIPFYKTPGFLLRVTVSIPIVFFIGYAIHQYAKEREFEELYGFKSSISFSLSPYLDLVKKISENSDNDEYRQFVIDTIRQIFDNPILFRADTTKKDKLDSNLVKDLLDRIIKIIEKGR